MSLANYKPDLFGHDLQIDGQLDFGSGDWLCICITAKLAVRLKESGEL